MSDLHTQLLAAALRQQPEHQPAFTEITSRARQRRKRALTVWSLATCAALAAVVGVVLLQGPSPRPSQDTAPTIDLTPGKAEPRPYREFDAASSRQVVLAQPPQAGRDIYSRSWELVGIDRSGDPILQIDVYRGCTDPVFFAERSDASDSTIALLVPTIPEGQACRGPLLVRVPMTEPLGERSLQHAPVDPRDADPAVEERPYKTITALEPLPMEAEPYRIGPGPEHGPIPWSLVGVSSDERSVFVRTTMTLNCRPEYTARRSGAGVVIGLYIGTTQDCSRPPGTLRIPLEEALGDRAIIHAPGGLEQPTVANPLGVDPSFQMPHPGDTRDFRTQQGPDDAAIRLAPTSWLEEPPPGLKPRTTGEQAIETYEMFFVPYEYTYPVPRYVRSVRFLLWSQLNIGVRDRPVWVIVTHDRNTRRCVGLAYINDATGYGMFSSSGDLKC